MLLLLRFNFLRKQSWRDCTGYLAPFLSLFPHYSWSHWSFTAGQAAEGQGHFVCNRAGRRKGTDKWRPCGKSTGGWALQQESITIPSTLGGGPKHHCWGMHWEKHLSFSTSPICPQSFLTFVELKHPFATKLPYPHLLLAASPSRQWRKDTSEIIRSVFPHWEEMFSVEDSGNLGFPFPLPYSRVSGEPKTTQEPENAIYNGQNKTKTWELVPFVSKLLSLNASQMFYFNIQSTVRCKLLTYNYDKIIMVNLTCAGT